jgi:hypothetical protein
MERGKITNNAAGGFGLWVGAVLGWVSRSSFPPKDLSPSWPARLITVGLACSLSRESERGGNFLLSPATA